MIILLLLFFDLSTSDAAPNVQIEIYGFLEGATPTWE